MTVADYKSHYRADAEFIEDPSQLPSVRRNSERRRLQRIVLHVLDDLREQDDIKAARTQTHAVGVTDRERVDLVPIPSACSQHSGV